MKRIIIIPATAVISILSIFFATSLFSKEIPIIQPKVLVVYDTPVSPVQMALAQESRNTIIRTFNQLGRFMPEEQNAIDEALSHTDIAVLSPQKQIQQLATALKADLIVSLAFSQIAKTHIADMTIRSPKSEYKQFEKSLRVQSKIAANIPLLLSKEIARIHTGAPVKATVLSSQEKGFALISAGQWNGITADSYRSDKGTLRVTQTGKYHAIVAAENLQKGDTVRIEIYPNASQIISEADLKILNNAIKQYAISEHLLKNQNDEARCLTTGCIINPGGNACLGGYGAFLSTYYLGFQNPAPAIDGMVISSLAYATQLLLIPSMTNFQANFFPWERDSDKTAPQQHLHAYLWATIPLTFSAAFLDQLAYQCHRSELLPPFFAYSDNTAAFISVIIPGGGLFYKGYRYTGWAYFLSEMSLGAYASYYWESGNKGRCALWGIAALKAIELLHAYFVKPAYSFFTREVATGKAEVMFSTTADEHNEMLYWVGLNIRL